MPTILDLYCGAGGAAEGYHGAGFDVTGVDLSPQPRYPFAFVQGDAIAFVRQHGRDFDAIHASPPCQAFSNMRHMPNAKTTHRDLITPTRRLLLAMGLPFVIENVVGAPLRDPLMLCGSMFGLQTRDGKAELWRHRLFETNWNVSAPRPCAHHAAPNVITVIGSTGGRFLRRATPQKSVRHRVGPRREAMGIDWMTNRELTQAIPPAYTEHIGGALLLHLRSLSRPLAA